MRGALYTHELYAVSFTLLIKVVHLTRFPSSRVTISSSPTFGQTAEAFKMLSVSEGYV